MKAGRTVQVTATDALDASPSRTVTITATDATTGSAIGDRYDADGSGGDRTDRRVPGSPRWRSAESNGQQSIVQ